VTNINFAEQPRKQARRLDNYFPTTKGIRPRLGTTKYATIDSGGADVDSMFVYKSGSAEKFFAADSADIYEITTVADKDVVPSSAVSSQTSGNYSTQNFATTATSYLYAVNGSDLAQLYDGTTWTQITGVSSPAITGVTTSTLSSVWAHGRRLWFVEVSTLSAWYLPVDSIGGAATEFLLSGVFRKGGALLFGTTWSQDSGAGMDDKCVFVSTEGEVAVYSGTDPSSVTTWSLDGVYDMSDALGKNAYYHVGGTPYFLTNHGVIPISEVIRKDKAQQDLAALTIPIEDQWLAEIQTRTTKDWGAVKWQENDMLFLLTPNGGVNDTTQYWVSNLETGAFSRWINWDATAGAVFSGNCYLGDSNGIIYRVENSGADDGASYDCACVMNFDDLNQPEATKTILQARANFVALNDVNAKLSVTTDYGITLPSFPGSIAEFDAADVWDTGLWDTAIWSSTINDNAYPETTMWQSIGCTGYSHALQIQQSFGIVPAHYSELISIACTVEGGGYVV
jgi:hypothetical protein